MYAKMFDFQSNCQRQRLFNSERALNFVIILQIFVTKFLQEELYVCVRPNLLEFIFLPERYSVVEQGQVKSIKAASLILMLFHLSTIYAEP